MPPLEGVEHRWVEARGIRFHVAEAGQGDDVVLCLHGWPQNWFEWRHLMPSLAAAGHRVLAMDLRGFGWSDAPADGYRKEQMADDVLAVLDRLEMRRVKLVGHDWGGWIGFLLALKAPHRFERYLALNIATPWASKRSMLLNSWRFWYQLAIVSPLGPDLHRRGRFVRKILVGGSTRKEVWDEQTLAVFADTLREPARAEAAVQVYRAFNQGESLEVARGRYADQRLTVPTSMLFGEDDFVLRPSMVAGYERHADEMTLELVPDCGHFIADERPDLVVARAIEFFRQPATASA